MADAEQAAPPSNLPTVVPTVGDLVATANGQLTATMAEITKVVEKGMIKALLIFGILFIWVSFALRVLSSVHTTNFSLEFTTNDLVVGVVTGSFFVVVAIGFKVYEYKKLTEWDQETRRISERISERAGAEKALADKIAMEGPAGNNGPRKVE
ncbi:MAG TPA: hypothetical protein VGD66_04350 [Allosphingosinicella sp.]|jgi:preprotein translocase subunit SecG